jgi:hypothetical protein
MGQNPNFGPTSLPMLAKLVVSKPTSPRPDGITFLGGVAFVAGVVLLIAAIAFALPYPDGWANGPALIGVWIMLSFGYFGFGQFLPGLFARIRIPIIVILAILYLAAGTGLFSGRRWAWTLGTTLALFGVASSILQAITSPLYDFLGIPGLIVTLMILVYLITPLARNFFFKRS